MKLCKKKKKKKKNLKEKRFLEATNKIVKREVGNNSFIQFQLWDFPGTIETTFDSTFDSDVIFSGCGAVVFVIDSKVKIYFNFYSNLNLSLIIHLV